MPFNIPENFLNRELSWLRFNERVLYEAAEINNPLLERLRFLAITSSNLDEFFMVRVGSLKNQLEDKPDWHDAAGMDAFQQLSEISSAVHKMVKAEYKQWSSLQHELKKENLIFSSPDHLSDKSKDWLRKYFEHTIFPVLTPLAVDASHPFPFLANKSLNLGVALLNKESKAAYAVIQVPGVLPRILEIPAAHESKRVFVFLEDVIRLHCHRLFHGFKLKNVVPFRITRNADFLIDEEETEDLLTDVEHSLKERKRGSAVRLEIASPGNKLLRKFLRMELELEEEDLFQIEGPLDLTCLFRFCDFSGMDALKYPPLLPYRAPVWQERENIFEILRERDLLLHHPYESFSPVIEFVRQAAADPEVLAIKQTLYRVSGRSPIVQALAQAAENGKQVTVIVEILARFDEANNIQWARRLEEAGCHVIYGVVGLKTHAKICLVVRREGGGIKRYVHMSTGNYNDSTARVYTDIGLFTSNDQFGADASGFFNVLTGYSDPPFWNKITVAPLGLRARLIELIEQESQFARSGKPARIIAKMNSLVDTEMVQHLYAASMAGVKIDLIIRGICVLRPGLPEISENITVRSIVGRFLEHSRIFFFSGGGEGRCWLSSADWMQRNLNARVELLFPVEDEDLRSYIMKILDTLLADNQKAHVMESDGSYHRIKANRPTRCAQNELLALVKENRN